MGAQIGLDARAVESVPNGLGTYARNLIRALTELDSDHSYIVIRRPNSGPPITIAPHVREVAINGDPSTPAWGYAISHLGLDLFHSLHHFLPFGIRIPRVVITLHDLIWLEHRDLIRNGALAPVRRSISHLYARVAMPYAVHHADRILAVSEHSRSRAVAYFGLDRSKIDVIHHGVDHVLFLPGRPHQGPSQHRYFFCLGNNRPYKNIPTTLHAFALCARERPELRLVVSGRSDSIGELTDLAQRLNLRGRVTFTGPVDQDELVRLLHGAEALVFPSYVEGFGLPVLEAMAAGCPVIASSCPTLTEISGDAALLCDPSSPAEFAAAMRRLLDDSTLQLELRARGVAQAAPFTWARCARRTLAVYNALLEGTQTQGAAPV